MKPRHYFGLPLALLILGVLLVPWFVQAQNPAVRVIIMDPTGTHAASVAGGNLGTTASVGDVTVESIATLGHITSAVHVAGIAQTVNVNCVVGCSAGPTHTAVTMAGHWNVSAAQSGLWSIAAAHIVGGSGHLAVTFAGGGHIAVTQATPSFKVQGDAAGTAVFIQGDTQLLTQKGTVPGLSDVGIITRSAGHTAVSFIGGGHIAITQAAAALQVDCSNCSAAATVTVSHVQSVTHVALVAASGQHFGAAQSGVWSVTAHQGGVWTVGQSATAWTIAHISSATHIVGTVTCTNCTGGSSDAVNVFHQSTIRHVSSVTHVYVVDLPRSAHLAAAQSGVWTVQAAHQGGAWVVNVQHIAAMLHVAIVDLPRWAHMAVAQSGVWNVTAHQGGTGYTIQHISSAVHIAGIIQVNCVTGCSAGAAHTAVTQAGQWNIAHITSVTHVLGNMTLRSVAGTAVTVTGTSLDVNCTGCSAAASVNVGHISGSVHIGGTIAGAQFHVQGLGLPGQAHGGVLTIQGVAGGVAAPVSGTVTANQGGTWTNLTIAHISGAVHIGGTIRGAMFHIQGVGTPGQAHGGVLTVQGIGGDATVLVATNTVPFRVAHITSALHVAGTIRGAQFHVTGLGIPGQTHGGVFTIQGTTGMIRVDTSDRVTDATCTTCTARVDHYNALVVQPHISGAFRASRVTPCGSGATIVVGTNPNRRDLYIQNIGGQSGHSNVYLGFGATGHVALTVANGWVLHAMTTSAGAGATGVATQLILPNYAGPLSCIAGSATTTVGIGIIEILR